MAGGRPTKYKSEFCDAVIECGKQGFSKTEMAVSLGIAYSSFDLWSNEIPEFSDAVKEARRQSQAWWEAGGRKGTFGEIEGYNSTSYIFQMKNRFRDDWNDTQRVVGSEPDGSHKLKMDADAGFKTLAGLLGCIKPGAASGPDEEG